MDVQIADDLVCAGFRRDRLLAPPRPESFDGAVGSDEEAAALLPICIGELVTGLERLVGPDEVSRQVNGWLDARRTRLAG
jgi:hypothetical protein